MIVEEWTYGKYEVSSKIVDEPELRYAEQGEHFRPDAVTVEWVTVDDVWMLHTVTIGGRRVLKCGDLGKQRTNHTWYSQDLAAGAPPAWVNEHVAGLTGPPEGV